MNNITPTMRAAQYLPEPNISGSLSNIVQSFTRVAAETIGNVPGMVSGDFGALISKQIEAQKELQATTMVSNIERSRHETKMSAIRNIRVG